MPTTTHLAPQPSDAGRRAHDLAPARGVVRVAGASYVLMFGAAILANFLVLEGLVVDGDAVATTANIADSPGLLRAGILAFLVIVLLDVVLAWALQVLLAEVDRHTAVLMAWFRLAYSAVLGVAVVFLVQALGVATGSSLSTSAQTVRTEQTMLSIGAFETTWSLGLALFGVHLVLLGVLVTRAAFTPRALGHLLTFAGLAYLADTVAQVALADYSAVSGLFLVLVAVPSMLGEGWLALWLLTTKRIPTTRLPQP